MNITQLTHRLQVYEERLANSTDKEMVDFYIKEIAEMRSQLIDIEAQTAVDDLLDEVFHLSKPWEVTTDCLQTVLDLCRDSSLEIIECDKGFTFSWWPIGFHWVWRIKYKMK